MVLRPQDGPLFTRKHSKNGQKMTNFISLQNDPKPLQEGLIWSKTPKKRSQTGFYSSSTPSLVTFIVPHGHKITIKHSKNGQKWSKKKYVPKSVKNIIKTLPGVQKGVSDTFLSILGRIFFFEFSTS